MASTSDPIVVRTKFLVPLPRKKLLHRPRVAALLDQITAHRLTIVQAGPGYGKSTAVALHLCSSSHQFFWYSTSGTDADPHVFMSHLVWSMRSAYPRMGGSALAIISQGLDATARRRAVEALANDMLNMQADAVLVIDDYAAPQPRDTRHSGLTPCRPRCTLSCARKRQPSAPSALARQGDVWNHERPGLPATSASPMRRLPAELTGGSSMAAAQAGSSPSRFIRGRRQLLNRSPAMTSSTTSSRRCCSSRRGVGAFLIDDQSWTSSTPQPAPPSPATTTPSLISRALRRRRSSPQAPALSVPQPHQGLPPAPMPPRLRPWAGPAAPHPSTPTAATPSAPSTTSWRPTTSTPPPASFPLPGARSGRVDGLAHLVDQLPGSSLTHPDLLVYRADAYRLWHYQNALAWYLADESSPPRATPAAAQKGKATVSSTPWSPQGMPWPRPWILPAENRLRRHLLRMMAEQDQPGQGRPSSCSAEQLINRPWMSSHPRHLHRTSLPLTSLAPRQPRRRNRRPPLTSPPRNPALALSHLLSHWRRRASPHSQAGIRLGKSYVRLSSGSGPMRLGRTLYLNTWGLWRKNATGGAGHLDSSR